MIDESEVVVVGLRTAEVVSELVARCRPEQLIIDLVNFPERARLRGQYQGICWS